MYLKVGPTKFKAQRRSNGPAPLPRLGRGTYLFIATQEYHTYSEKMTGRKSTLIAGVMHLRTFSYLISNVANQLNNDQSEICSRSSTQKKKKKKTRSRIPASCHADSGNPSTLTTLKFSSLHKAFCAVLVLPICSNVLQEKESRKGFGNALAPEGPWSSINEDTRICSTRIRISGIHGGRADRLQGRLWSTC